MAVSFSTRKLDGVMVLDLTGRLILGSGDMGVHDRVMEQVAAGERRLVLNLSGVSYIDSSGLGEMARALAAARRGGAELKLSSPTGKVHDLIRVTNLYKIFDVQDTDEAAARAFGG